MGAFKDFYNSLDFLNLILFWGTIIVIILIIIFLTLYFSRKKSIIIKTKDINKFDFEDIDIIKHDSSNLNISNDNINIIKKDNSNLNIKTIKDDNIDQVNEDINNHDDTMEIPIQKKKLEVKIDNPIYEKKENNIVKETRNVNIENKNITIEPINESKNVIIERHVIEPTIEKKDYNTIIEKNNIDSNKKDERIVIEKPIIENKEYNINIEKEIVKKNNNEFLFDELVKNETNINNSIDRPKAYQKNVFREMNSRNQTSPIGIVIEKKTNPIEEYKESLNEKNDNYLENVYTSLSQASVPDKIELTEYEKKQEEDAVISYQELIKKKDTIDYDKEEDAVISYGELLNRSSRLYNITPYEKDKEFLSELKQFRKDL